MNTFRITKSYRIYRIMNCSYPIVALICGFLLISNGYYTITDWAPIAMISMVLWFIYELLGTIKDFSFSVTLSDKFIRVGETSKLWSEITRAKICRAFGRKAAITLYTKSGEQIEIPAVIESIGYIKKAMKIYLTETQVSIFN